MNQWPIVFIIHFIFMISNVFADDYPLKKINPDVSNQAKLQRGASLYMNYCSGCHSLRYMRYSRMAKDLGLTTFDGAIDKKLLMSNLVFTSAKPHDPISISMPEVDARQWFGKMPPDLSLSAREKGANWIYTYLSSFYFDDARPFRSNNLLVPDVAMPNILAPLQGTIILRNLKNNAKDISDVQLVLTQEGRMSQMQFDSALQDLVTFLAYVAEPDYLKRHNIGKWVVLFLILFAVIVYFLKRSYWKRA